MSILDVDYPSFGAGMTVSVTVKMLGDLREYLPAGSGFNECQAEVEQGSTIEQLLLKLRLPDDRAFLLTVNNKLVHQQDYANTGLTVGDEVIVFPPIKAG